MKTSAKSSKQGQSILGDVFPEVDVNRAQGLQVTAGLHFATAELLVTPTQAKFRNLQLRRETPQVDGYAGSVRFFHNPSYVLDQRPYPQELSYAAIG